MFTGIVEEVGRIDSAEDRGDTRVFGIGAPGIVPFLALGDSVAVDGACLTVARLGDGQFFVDAIGTTLSRTVASGYRAGTKVNLERAMVLGQRLDGHLVQGHVDGLGVLTRIGEADGFRLLDFEIPREVWEQTILHGSICINGISLTVNALDAPDRCQVAIIPHTWQHTNLSSLNPGDPVNLEGDLIGKYVGKMLATRGLDGSAS